MPSDEWKGQGASRYRPMQCMGRIGRATDGRFIPTGGWAAVKGHGGAPIPRRSRIRARRVQSLPLVSSDVRPLLAIRTIVVTTRAAVRSHRAAGNEELARESAQRGAEMLTELGSRLSPEAPGAIGQAYRDAEHELQTLTALAADRSMQV